MDVKAVNSTSAALQMQSQNVENQKEIQNQNREQNQQKDLKEMFETLEPKMQEDIIKKSIDELNKKMSMLNSQLKIEMDEDTGIQVVKIIDSESKEVIRQLPPDVVLKIAKYIDEVTGLLFNEKA
ncbi:flagellar protein FlaG [Nitrosophilus labii]|uniref:flagellar protein FlaG n=1 Tax=Nitrosophilus labii TaxID=2706014 RepID=UPI001656B215|nr:flagellar protein FlaG [Nitrosophilus labii]